MKYMIMLYASQRDYDAMAGKGSPDSPAWQPEDVAAMHEYMGKWNQALIESGEFVDAHGLSAPVHTRRITGVKDGVPVVTDGPYAETQEVLAGYNVVECPSFDRATELAAQITLCPAPAGIDMSSWYVDVRPIDDGPGDIES
ncbi:YciI family protein [Micromonospora sp. CPCC 206061]|uniref:YciI family protein n=1 Tax=Micromonospora sp. CPCC 206061 TaxID=3122410 RepID=UPI002FF03712